MNDFITTENDMVNRPSHYCEGRQYQPIDVIMDWNLDFCLGNTVKYISRAGRKGDAEMTFLSKEIEDLEKAEYYLKYKISELKSLRRSLGEEDTKMYQE